MDENVVKIRELVLSDHHLTWRMIVDELDMSKGTVRKILNTESWYENVSSEVCAVKLDGGTKGQMSHFEHGLCTTTSG
jgi:hypothetical protein